jgi:hypothetical protein
MAIEEGIHTYGGVPYTINVLVLVIADFVILVRASATMANRILFFLAPGLSSVDIPPSK